MQTESDSSRIERTKRSLAGTDTHTGETAHTELTPLDIDVSNDWNDTEIITERVVKKRTGGIRALKYLIVASLVAVISSGGYLLYQIFDPFSKPSDKNILITFDVPVGITPGVPADILVRVNNQNRVAIEYANMTLSYPEGTKNSTDPSRDLRDEKKVLGQIPAGQSAEFHTRVIFLGEENTDKELRSSLEYRFANINSVFSKETVRQVHLLASPINLTVDTLKQVNSGQELEITINAASNTVIPLNDVLVTIEYPLGFTPSDASPKPTFGNNVWRIGTMDPAGKFTVKIRGVLSGEDTQEKVFHTTVGAASDQTERGIRTVYSKVLSSIEIQRPFIGITLLLGEKLADQAVSHFGEHITGTVLWQNNLSTRIVDVQIDVHLSGAALDRSSIASNAGYYRSSDDTIIWDERGVKELADVEAGARGGVEFAFAPLPSVSGTQLLTNPTITAKVTVRGKRISESGVPEEIKTVMTQSVKISSETQFKPWIVHYTGPFANTGPVPPRVEQETSYTVWWSIRNTSNAISDTEVRATLPPYVRYSGTVSPTNADVTYDANSNEVIWKPGDIPVGAGNGNIAPREVAFQIIFTPSLSHVQTVPALIKNIRFTGVDSFTGEAVVKERGDLGGILVSEPRAPRDSGMVQK